MSCNHNEVNAGMTAYIEMGWLDKDCEPITDAPTSVSVEIIDVLSKRIIRAAANVTPVAAQMEIELTPADNIIVDSNHLSEQREVIATALFGSKPIVGKAFYFVRA